MQQDRSDESGQQNYRAQLDVPDNKRESWTDGNTVARDASGRRDHLARPPRRRRDLRKELRGTEVLEAIMAEFVVTLAIAVFLGGLMVGVLAAVAVAIRREERHHTLAVEAPDRLSRNARWLTGVTRRGMDDEFIRPVGTLVR
jgi:hypothetical protein